MRKITDLLEDRSIRTRLALDNCPIKLGKKNRVNIIALGDVGATVLMGLRLLGGSSISEIGICDINEKNVQRLEMEVNQINYPFGINPLPKVRAVQELQLFNCDVLIFCASKRVPDVGATGDMRMIQLDANRKIISYYANLAKKENFSGLVAIVSDPVDPLCKEFLTVSKLKPSQIQGYGLGVMNARALYYAERDSEFSQYLQEGRAFGPHGKDLVIADSIENYDDMRSRKLTKLVVNANMEVREMGYKPYIAPAMSSAAISILLTLEGKWHYSSLYFGNSHDGAFLGIKNKMTPGGPIYEDVPLCDTLYERVKKAFFSLCDLK